MILESEKMPEERRERVHRNKADGHVMKMWVSDRSDEEEEVEQVEDRSRGERRGRGDTEEAPSLGGRRKQFGNANVLDASTLRRYTDV